MEKSTLSFSSGKGISCLDCGQWFSDILSFKMHIDDHHRGATPIQCQICSGVSFSLHKFRQHLLLHRQATLTSSVRNRDLGGGWIVQTSSFEQPLGGLKRRLTTDEMDTLRPAKKLRPGVYPTADNGPLGAVGASSLHPDEDPLVVNSYSGNPSVIQSEDPLRVAGVNTVHFSVEDHQNIEPVLTGKKCDFCDEVFGDEYHLAMHRPFCWYLNKRAIQCEVCRGQFANSDCLRRHRDKTGHGAPPRKATLAGGLDEKGAGAGAHIQVQYTKTLASTAMPQEETSIPKPLNVSQYPDNLARPCSSNDQVDDATNDTGGMSRKSSLDSPPTQNSEHCIASKCGGSRVRRMYYLEMQCPWCPRFFRDSWKLARHMRTKAHYWSRNDFPCYMCGTTFESAGALSRHASRLGHRMVNSEQVVLASDENVPAGAIQVTPPSSDATWPRNQSEPYLFRSDLASGLDEAYSAGMSGEEASMSKAGVDPLSVMPVVSAVSEDLELHLDLDADEAPPSPATLEGERNCSDCDNEMNIFEKSKRSWKIPDSIEEHGASQEPFVDDALPLSAALDDGGEDSDSGSVVILASKSDSVSESTDPSKEHSAPQDFDEGDTLRISAAVEAGGEDSDSDSVMSLSDESDSVSESPDPSEEHGAPQSCNAAETLPLSSALEDGGKGCDYDSSKRPESASKSPDPSKHYSAIQELDADDSLPPSAVEEGGGDEYGSDCNGSLSKNPDHPKETQSRGNRVSESPTVDKAVDLRKCPLCWKRLGRHSDVARHLKSLLHAGRSSYDCDGCSAKFRTVNSLMRHRTSKHLMSTVSPSKNPDPPKELSVQRPLTSDRVVSRGPQLKKPRNEKQRATFDKGGKKFNCVTCDQTFATLYRFQRHLATRKHKIGTTPQTRSTSGDDLQSPPDLQTHQLMSDRRTDSNGVQQNAEEHPQPQKAAGLSTLQQNKPELVSGEQQNGSFGDSKRRGNPKRAAKSTPAQLERKDSRLTGRTRKRIRPKFKCPVCPKLVCSSNLSAHLYQVHRGQKVYKCSACPEDFWSYTARKRHIILKHREALPANGLSFSKSDKLSSGRIKHEVRSSVVRCPLCSKMLSNVKLLTGHLILMHPDEKAFTCSSCNERFSTLPELKCHLVSVHGQPMTYTCMVCGEEMATSRDHTEIHRRDPETTEASAVSATVSLPSVSVSDLSQSSSGQQNTVTRKRCWKSPEASPARVSNDFADTSISVDPRKCPLCPKRLCRPADVLRHLNGRMHAGQSWYSCDMCSSRFRTANSLMRHRTSEHATNIGGGSQSSDPREEPGVPLLSRTGREELEKSSLKPPRTSMPARTCESVPKTFNCMKCDKKFASFYHFQQHLASRKHKSGGSRRATSSIPTRLKDQAAGSVGRTRKRTKKEVSCPLCQRRVWAWNLSAHLRSVTHRAEKAFKCAACPADFWTPTALNRHIMLKHCETRSTNSILGYRHFRVLSSSDMGSSGGGKQMPNNRPFSCPLCSARTSSASKLDRHLIRLHPDEKLFMCSSCSERFSTLSDLKLHLTSQHGQPITFTCRVCGEEMAYSGDHTELHRRDAEAMEASVPPGNSSISLVPVSGTSQPPSTKQDTNTRKKSWKTPESTGFNTKDTDVSQSVDARKCPLCPKLLGRPVDVLRHLKTRLHAGQRWYNCDGCSAKFRTANSLMRHRTSKHLTGIDGASKSANPGEEHDAQQRPTSDHEEFQRPVIKPPGTVNARLNSWTCTVCGEKIATKDAHVQLHSTSAELSDVARISPEDVHELSHSTSDASQPSPDRQELQGPHHDTDTQRRSLEARGISPAVIIPDHTDFNRTVDPRKCPLCPKLLARPVDVLRHLTTRLHAGQNWYGCDVCSSRFRTASSLMRHRTAEHLTNMDNAASSSVLSEERGVQQFSNSDRTAAENSEVNSPSDDEPTRTSDSVHKKFKCWKCNIRFPTLSDFQRHLTTRMHNSGRMPPVATTREVSSQDAREIETHGRVPFKEATTADMQQDHQDHPQHQKEAGAPSHQLIEQQPSSAEEQIIPRVFCSIFGSTRFKCPKCDKTFKTKYEVRRHLTKGAAHRPPVKKKNLWSKNAPITSFISRGMPRYRMPSQFTSCHKPAQYKCPKCDKTFGKIYDVLRHLASKMHGAGNFLLICSVCGKGFSGVKTLKEHQRIHGTTVSTPFLLEVQEDEEIRHPLLAGDQSLQKPEQKGHRESAGARAPAQPPSAKENSKGELDSASVSISKAPSGDKRRMDDRSTNEPFRIRCPICSKSLHYQNLPRHLRRVHPGQRGYKCYQCKQGFFTAAGLAQHGAQEGHLTQLFRCRVCGEQMKHRLDHVALHKPDQSLVGNLSSTRESSKLVHDKSSSNTESLNMPSQCSRCGEGFKTVFQRKQHRCLFELNGHDEALLFRPGLKMCQIRIRRCDEEEPKEQMANCFGQDRSQVIKMESSLDGKYNDMINSCQDLGSMLYGVVKVEEVTTDLEITSQLRVKEEPVAEHDFNDEGQNFDGNWLTGCQSELSQDAGQLSGIGMKLEPQEESVNEDGNQVEEAEQKYRPPHSHQV